MPRVRTIKPDFWDDEKLATISREARLTYVGMWTFSDDYAVVKANPTWLQNHIFPYDNIPAEKFSYWLESLEKLGRAIPFDVNGEAYYYLPKFLVHQKINRPSDRRNPEVPVSIQDGLSESSVSPHGDLSDERGRVGVRGGGKGKGIGKGKGKESGAAKRTRAPTQTEKHFHDGFQKKYGEPHRKIAGEHAIALAKLCGEFGGTAVQIKMDDWWTYTLPEKFTGRQTIGAFIAYFDSIGSVNDIATDKQKPGKYAGLATT